MTYIFCTDVSLPVHTPKFKTVGEGRRTEQFYEALKSGETIDPAPLPKIEQLKSRHKSIPDVHQFIEIKLLDKQGKPYDKSYFRFHIRHWLDAMIIEKSTLVLKKVALSDRYMWRPSEPPSREHFTASKDIISGWTGRCILQHIFARKNSTMLSTRMDLNACAFSTLMKSNHGRITKAERHGKR